MKHIQTVFFYGDEEWSLPLMASDFLHYYNSKRVHSTTKIIPREILFNFKNKSIVEQVIVNTKNSRKAFLQEIYFEVGDSVLLISEMTELPNKRIRSYKRGKANERYKRWEARNSYHPSRNNKKGIIVKPFVQPPFI